MGSGGEFRTDEDEQCALYLRNLLEGRLPDIAAVKKLILTGNESDKFDDSTLTHFHPQDRELALQINSIPFAIKVKKEDGLLSLGTVLTILGSIGYMFVWSLDYHILWGQHIENAWQIASLGMTMEIGIVMLFGVINWSGVQCFSSALGMRGYGNSAIVKVTSVFAGLHVVNHFYTIFNLDPMSASSIMPFFIGMSIGQLVLFAFNISLGMGLLKKG